MVGKIDKHIPLKMVVKHGDESHGIESATKITLNIQTKDKTDSPPTWVTFNDPCHISYLEPETLKILVNQGINYHIYQPQQVYAPDFWPPSREAWRTNTPHRGHRGHDELPTPPKTHYSRKFLKITMTSCINFDASPKSGWH